MSTDEPKSTLEGSQAGPLPAATAWRAVARCVIESARMLATGVVHWPRVNVGRRLRFADGTTGEVYRETSVAVPAAEPCLLVVGFRLRLVRGRGHVLFRWESWLNTPLFVGFPGFVSKLWLAADEHGRYRGFYEWDEADLAEHYARSLWRVLALVSEPGSIDFRVVPGMHRDEVLADPGLLDGHADPSVPDWWCLAGTS
ncbi:hypothetical protein ACIA03_09985 [Nocardioides sp. NPDC051685]|uniref:hypothetical protein n=1 Tax=Nocardioides sp. NPDC051685 TaxID=3364334 RepID=UPI0037B365EA